MNAKTLRDRVARAWRVLCGTEAEPIPLPRKGGHATLTVTRDMVEELTIRTDTGNKVGTVLRYDTELLLDGLDIDLQLNLDQPGPGPDNPEHFNHNPHQRWLLRAGDKFHLDISHHQVPGDSELMDWLCGQAEQGVVTFGFEMDGGVYLNLELPSHTPLDIREADDLRVAIRRAKKLRPLPL